MQQNIAKREDLKASKAKIAERYLVLKARSAELQLMQGKLIALKGKS